MTNVHSYQPTEDIGDEPPETKYFATTSVPDQRDRFLFAVERTDEVDYDEHIGVVVCAYSTIDAIVLLEDVKEGMTGGPIIGFHWGTLDNVSVKRLGAAFHGVDRGVILESYKYG